VISPDPVDQVQRTVATKGKQVVSGDGFSFTSFTDHEQLRKDGNTLKVDTEGPENFQRSEFVVDEESEATNWHDKKFSSESVVVSIVCSLEFHVDEINGGVCAGQVNDLHNGIVRRNKVCEQIKVTSGEDKSKHHLSFSRYSSAGSCFPYLHQQKDDGK